MISAYSAETIRQLEAPYLQDPAYDGWLMARAASGLAGLALSYLRDQPTVGQVLLLVGGGNNGADTLYAGAQLAQAGYRVQAYLFKKEALPAALLAFQEAGGSILPRAELVQALESSTLLLDGLLGIGASGKPSPEMLELFSLVRQSRRRPHIIACDTPSGLSASNSGADGSVLVADQTATFIALKDFMLGPGEHFCGQIHLYDLGLSPDLEGYEPEIQRWEERELVEALIRPHPFDHKYSRGICGLVAGSARYPGAAHLAGAAALATGCGMVSFFGPEALGYGLVLQHPEIVMSQEATAGQKVDAWVLGPGASGEDREGDILGALHTLAPAVIDAAALEVAARWVGDSPLTPAQILTPHAGELLRVLNWLYLLKGRDWAEASNLGEPSRSALEENPVPWLKLAARLTGATVLLKGGTTLIAQPDGRLYSVRGQSPWLATAGSGDTLSGILGSLLAQYSARQGQAEVNPGDYARLAALATYLHNQAALAVHGGALGPVPPTLLAGHLASAISRLLAS